MQINKLYIFSSIVLIIFAQLAFAQVATFEKQRTFISMAGTWKCDLGIIHLPGTIDETQLAPRTKDTQSTGQLTRLHPFVGEMVYTKTFEISAKHSNKEWRLLLERTKPSTVWIDGNNIGSNQTILSQQVYKIGTLKKGSHQIKILIDNSASSVPSGIQGSHAWTDATQTNWNGIIGKIGIEGNDNGLLIENIKIDAHPSQQLATAWLSIQSSISGNATIVINSNTWNTSNTIQLPTQKIKIQLKKGTHPYCIQFNTGTKQTLWSEFDPALYKAHFELRCGSKKDFLSVNFGIRSFNTSGTQFTINGIRTFLRGKHDGCVFLLTGYPPMDKKEWQRQFRISKQYGINHYRFHSWTPPQAAFDAANEEGIYIQSELPYWGFVSKDSILLNHFLMQEGKHILDSYGNNPSFVMMALGNELSGNPAEMKTLVDELKHYDNRRLYAMGSNNNLGTAGQQPGDDFFVTCRVGGNVGTADYTTHSRSSFSFADAKNGGYLNGIYPTTDITFSNPVAHATIPIISHENGQFQVYPNYNEIKKYTGVLYPYNLEIFRRRLAKNNLQQQANAFHSATGKFAAICYKADIEMCLRTPNFGGFQLLDLQDYPGQGSAYVGLLDAFMDSKEAISSKTFNGFCNSIVPLAVMPKYCWNNDEEFTAAIKIFNYSHQSIQEQLHWNIVTIRNNETIASGLLPVDAAQGTLSLSGNLQTSLRKIKEPTQLKLMLRLGDHENSYDIWVYPNKNVLRSEKIWETHSLDTAISLLASGQKVLLTPIHDSIMNNSVGGMFTPDYWNYAMFKNISEYLKRDVSPGTLSILTNPAHSLFKNFPTDSCSNWQWWIISRNARPLILNNTPANYKPIVQVVDNIERNHKLGILFEMEVNKGKLLVSMCQLDHVLYKPEGRAFKNALLQYMESENFVPQYSFTKEDLIKLFTEPIAQQNITGIKNITTYQ